MIPVHNILRSVYRLNDPSHDKMNIITICRNTEKYIKLMCATGHNFYLIDTHPWNSLIEKQPDNVYILNPHSPPIDCIVCYDRAEQYGEAQHISSLLHIPIILVDLCSEALVRPHHILENLQLRNPQDLHRHPTLRVCSTPEIQRSWNATDSPSHTIPIGVDLDTLPILGKPEQTIISIDNNVVGEVGAHLASLIGERYPLVPTDHDNPANKTVLDSKYFVNTQQTVTVKLLEAMAANNVVLTLRNPDTESLIEHLVTGILLDKLEEIPQHIKNLEDSPEARLKIAKAARQKILADHTLDPFISNWTKALDIVRASIYTPET